MPFGSEGIEPGVALALSGGGFRATLFHIDALWRLNELGYLSQLERLSSVSGGSITAGFLGLKWQELNFQEGVAQNFETLIADPLRKFCTRHIDGPAIGEGVLLPWKRVSEAIREEYQDHLFGKTTLQDLPERPRFVINATNYATGVSFRFSRPYAGDYQLGLIENPDLAVALAVAASSAFPPVLSPVVIDFKPGQFQDVPGADLNNNPHYTETVYLTDGGVYDNLGLETIWNRYDTLLVSDAGAPLQVESEVETAWHSQALRALDITTNQARAMRKRVLINTYENKARKGAYWGINTEISDYGLSDTLPVDLAMIHKLARLRTRLNPFSEKEQGRLINWGYAVCDAAMRRYVLPQTPAPQPQWPYPRYRLG